MEISIKEYVEMKNTVLAMPFPNSETLRKIHYEEPIKPVEYSWEYFWDMATPFNLYGKKYGTYLKTLHAFNVGKYLLMKNLEFKYAGRKEVEAAAKVYDDMPDRPRLGRKRVYFYYEGDTYKSHQLYGPLSTKFINRVRSPLAYSIKVRDKPYICFPMDTQRITDCTNIEDISYILEDTGNIPYWLPDIEFSPYDVNNFEHPLFETMRETGNYVLKNPKYEEVEDVEMANILLIR